MGKRNAPAATGTPTTRMKLRERHSDVVPDAAPNQFNSQKINLQHLSKTRSGKKGKSAAAVQMKDVASRHVPFNLGQPAPLLKLFAQADDATGDFIRSAANSSGQPTFALFKPIINHHARQAHPVAPHRLSNDDSSHMVSQALVLNDNQANRRDRMIAENYIGNQVVQAETERQAEALAAQTPHDVFVQRDIKYDDSGRPNQVTSTVLRRSNSGNNIRVMSSYQHGNEDVPRNS